MRVGIIALLQESNTFIAGATTLAHFAADLLAEGEQVRRRMVGTHHEVGGFFAGLDAAGIEAVPIFAARALPFGVMTSATLDALLARMTGAVDRAGRLDGLLVAPHGATVSEAIADVDGCWLELLRGRVGPGVPIVGTLDLHANVSARMVAACDALVAYRTNPHIDQRERGIEAAQLIARTLRGDVHPCMAAVLPPLAVNIERQLTAEPPCRPLYALTAAVRQRPEVLSASLLLGFPYADVAEMGAAVIAVTNGDPAGACDQARALARAWWERRAEFQGQLIGVDTALVRAAQTTGPVCLLDMGDNAGGGSPADGTVLLHALHAACIAPAFACLHDPDACQVAQQAGAGARIRLRVGGKTDRLHGEPFEAEFRVRGTYTGQFEESEVRHGGIRTFDQGPTAVVESDGLTVMLTSRRMPPFSLRQLTSCGIDPSQFRVLVAKGVHAPVAAYAPVCREMIRVDTPGVTSADLSRLTYHNRRRPMFPFEPETQWEPSAVTMGHRFRRAE